MEQEAKKSFAQVISMMEDVEPDNPHVTHDKFECDGCGVFPIVGTRYKCSVCKNFDFCSRCEELVPHDHAFLKLVNPKDNPVMILTALNDDEQPATHHQEERKEAQPNHHCNLPGFLSGNEFWQQFQGNADQWKEHAMNWANQVRDCMARPNLRLQVVSKPEYAVKGNPNETVIIPIEIKKVG